MKQSFRVENVKCGGCANTLKSKLAESFGEIEVNLDLFPREITLDIDEMRVAELGEALKKLGYPLSSQKLGFIDSTTTKAKSFVSCAIGKMDE
jgi:copper chaperone CopZ